MNRGIMLGLIFVCLFGIPSPSQTVTFKFAPPDRTGVKEINVRRSTEQIVGSTNAPLHDEQNIEFGWFRQRKPTFVEMTMKEVSFSEVMNGKPFKNYINNIAEGSTMTYEISNEGQMLSATSDVQISDVLRTHLPTNMLYKLEEDLKPDHVYAGESAMWNEKIAQFAGKTVNIGEIWTNDVKSDSQLTMHWLIKFSRILEKEGRKVIQIDSYGSTDESPLLRLDMADLNEQQRTDFFKWEPIRSPSERMVVRTQMDLDTMDLIHYESLLLEIHKTPAGYKRTVENSASQFSAVNQ